MQRALKAFDRFGGGVERVGDRLDHGRGPFAPADAQAHRHPQVLHRPEDRPEVALSRAFCAVEAGEDRVDLRLVLGEEDLALGGEREQFAPALLLEFERIAP